MHSNRTLERFQRVSHIIETYQKQNPDVLLNLGMDSNFDIYTFGALRAAVTTDGTDGMEVDTLFLSFLPVALVRSTVNEQLWGIPNGVMEDDWPL